MSTGSWDPQQGVQEDTVSLTSAELRVFIALSEADKLADLGQELDLPTQQLGSIMRWDEADWQDFLEPLTEGELLHLLRFFCVAEVQLAGWQAEEKSPVIAITRLLKRRGQRLDKELLLWIRQQNPNRYLPNGPLL